MRPHLHLLLLLTALAIVSASDTVAAQTRSVTSVAEALADGDGDRVPDRLGDTVTVEGIIISTPLVLNPDASLVNVQDTTGGLVLFTRDTTALQALTRGDSVRARGRLDQYRGAEQLLVQHMERLGRTGVPAPEDVLVSDLEGERFFGQLVRVAGILTARQTEAGWVDVELADRTGAIPVYISSRWLTHPGFAEQLRRGGAVEVTGIASQDTESDPPVDGYRIVPRDVNDFGFPARPPYGLLAAVALGILALVLLWWQRRERRRARTLEQLTRDLQRSQEELRAREERFRSLVENAADTMSILGPDGQVLYQSPSVKRMLGWEAEDLEGRNGLELVHPEDRDRVRAVLEDLVGRPGESVDVEFRVQAKDGSWHRVEVTGTNRLHDPAVRGIVCNTRDVTQNRILEQLVRDADRIEAVGRLAGGIAHDFNNVLTALRGHAELALGELEPGSAVRHEVEEIVRGAERATALTQQLLAFSRQRVMQPKVIAPGAVLASMLPMLHRLIGEDIELTTEIESEVGNIRTDPVQLEQVVMNLVVNARDAMPDGGRVTLELADDRITPGDADAYPYHVEPGEYVRLSVADTGRGMDEEVLSHVFDPFFTTKDQGQGTGLGLATLFGIVKQSSGYVWANSEPGAGSRFDVFIPRVSDPVPDVRSDGDSATGARAGRGETILLVEDEDSVRTLMRRVLERNGYHILEASDPEIAIRLARDHTGPLDLLFTDVVMPGMSGGELAQRLRAERSGLATLFTSGYTEDEVVRRGVSAGDAWFLEKPFTPTELLRVVQEILDGEVDVPGEDAPGPE